MVNVRAIFGRFGHIKPSSDMAKQEEQPMSTVALIDKKMNEIIQIVETENVQYTIDQLMRNRDPREVIAREIKIGDWLHCRTTLN